VSTNSDEEKHEYYTRSLWNLFTTFTASRTWKTIWRKLIRTRRTNDGRANRRSHWRISTPSSTNTFADRPNNVIRTRGGSVVGTYLLGSAARFKPQRQCPNGVLILSYHHCLHHYDTNHGSIMTSIINIIIENC